ncbi:MAG: sulfotransferase [Sinimarinibacterium sp.]
MLIIGGGYRCGTTSLFSYLAGHPEISPSLIKEPGFFFSLRLHQNPSPYPPGHEVWAYRSMFRKRGARVLMEGTSNYLNDPGCAARIARALPRAKVVLLLREPVARLVSWYKFLRLQNQLPPGMAFEEWIRSQLADTQPTVERPYAMQAVDHCRYAPYVAEFLSVLGADRVLPVWFDDLKRAPQAVMERICRFAGIRADYYADFTFPAQNESMKIVRPRLFGAYRKLHRALTRALSPWPRLQHEFKVQLFGVLEPKLLPLFTGPADPVDVSPALRQLLQHHFSSDIAPLRELTGSEAPWQASYPAR